MPELRVPKPRSPALKLDEVVEAAGVTAEDPSQTSAIERSAALVSAGEMSSDEGDFSNTDSDEEDDVMIKPIVNRPLALSRGISVDLQLQTTTSLVRRASVSGAPPPPQHPWQRSPKLGSVQPVLLHGPRWSVAGLHSARGCG